MTTLDPTTDVTKATVGPFAQIPARILWYENADVYDYYPYLIQVENMQVAVQPHTLDFKFIDLQTHQAGPVRQIGDLLDIEEVWGDPNRKHWLPATLYGARPGDFAILFLTGDGLGGRWPEHTAARGTGKWPKGNGGGPRIGELKDRVRAIITDPGKLKELDAAIDDVLLR